MKLNKIYLPLLTLLIATPASAQFAVVDAAALVRLAAQIRLAEQQLQEAKTELVRLGDPAAVTLDVARTLQRELTRGGAARTLQEVQAAATGLGSLAYDGNGLYVPPGEFIVTADGRQTPRVAEAYRKYDAVTQAKNTLEDVMHDTAERRQHLRQQMGQTLGQLNAAGTMAEIAKLSAVLQAQTAELSEIDHEREAALSRVLVQHIENETDASRQALAQREDRAAVMRTSNDKLKEFLKPNPSPVTIPDPRQLRP